MLWDIFSAAPDTAGASGYSITVSLSNSICWHYAGLIPVAKSLMEGFINMPNDVLTPMEGRGGGWGRRQRGIEYRKQNS